MRLERFNAYGGFSVPARGYGSDICALHIERYDVRSDTRTITVGCCNSERDLTYRGRSSRHSYSITFDFYLHPSRCTVGTKRHGHITGERSEAFPKLSLFRVGDIAKDTDSHGQSPSSQQL